MADDEMRIGVLGLHHDHVWDNLTELEAVPAARLVAAADPDPALVARAAERYGCSGFGGYGDLLEAGGVDAVYVFANNRDGAALVAEAAGRGLPVMVEKPLAADLAGAGSAVEAAARGAGAPVMCNWPFAWWPAFQAALALAAEGAVGRVWQTRYRAAHQGPKEYGCSPEFYGWLYDPELNGGGALADYGCYGAALARTLMGVPEQVTAVAVNCCRDYLEAEDNAVIVMQYPNGLATAEASWSQIGEMTSYVTVICGTEGTLLVEPGPEGRLLLADAENTAGRPLPVEPLPPERAGASAHFVHAVRTGEPFIDICSLGVARDAQAVLEAARASAATCRPVAVAR